MPESFNPFIPQDDSFGDIFRESGGVDVRQFAAERAARQAEEQAAFAQWQDQQAMQQMADQQSQLQASYDQSSEQFLDWPTYTQTMKDTPPHMAYDEYVGAALPWQLEQMGYTPEEAQREVQMFMQQVPRPEAEYGFFGNLFETAREGMRSGTRALESAGNVLSGDREDLAALVAEQGGVERVGPLQRFQQGMAAGSSDESWWESAKDFAANAWENPEGAANFLVEQMAQSYPVLAAALGGALAGSAVPVVGTTIGGAAGLGAGSMTLDAGLGVLERIASEARKQGINPNDQAAVANMLQDTALYEELRNTALARGATVGAVDGMMSMLSFGLGGAAARAARAGRGLRATGIAAGGVGAETLGAGAGELAGQVVAGDPRNWMEVVAEMGGEVGPGAAQVGLGAAFGALRRPPVTPEPTPTGEPGIDEGDLAAFGEPTALPPIPRLNEAVGAAPIMVAPDGTAFEATPENIMAYANRRLEEITAEDLTVEEIDAAPAPDEMPRTPSTAIDVVEGTPEEITLTDQTVQGLLPLLPGQRPPLAADAQGNVADPDVLQRARDDARIAALAPTVGSVDVNDVESLLDRMVARNIDVSSDEMQQALETIALAPRNDKQAAIADVILGLGDSQDPNADAVSLELIRIARTLRADPVRTPVQRAESIAQVATDLGVAPEQVVPVVAQALAQEVVEGVALNGPTTTSPSQPAVAAPTPDAPVRTRRGLRSGEAVPPTSLGFIVGQLTGGGPVEGAGRADQTQGQPRGGLRARVAQEGTQPRGLARSQGADPAGREGSDRVQPNRNAGAADVRSLRKLKPYSGEIAEAEGKRGGIAAIDDFGQKYTAGEAPAPKSLRTKADEKKAVDKAADDMMAKLYGDRYPGREIDLDMAEVIDADRKGDTNERLSPGLTRALQMSNADGVLQYLGSVMSNPLARMIANNMRDLNLNVRFELVPGLRNSKGEKANGNFKQDETGMTVFIDPDSATMSTVLHELVHAAVAAVINNPLTEQDRVNVQHLNNLFMYVKDKMAGSKQYGLSNLQEFVAEALSNYSFQQELAKIPVKSKFGLRNALEVFKRMVLRFLGLDKSTNALSEAVLTAQELFGKNPANLELAQQASQVLNAYAATPSNAILGDRNGVRTFIAYPTKPGSPSTTYTLYPVTGNPRGDPAGKIVKLTRQQTEDYIRNAGSQVIAPKAETTMAGTTPKETKKQQVGYNREGNLVAVAFEQKDGTWTYYESATDVRRDPDAKVLKGLTKAQVERALQAKGTTTTPPKPKAVQPASDVKTSIGYKPTKATSILTSLRSRNQSIYTFLEQAAKQGVDIPREGRIDAKMVLSNSNALLKGAQVKETYLDPIIRAGADIMRTFNVSQQKIEDALLQSHNIERQQHKIRQIQNSKGFTDAEKAARVNAANAKIATAQRKIAEYNSAQPQFVPTVQKVLAPLMKALTDNTQDMRVEYQLASREDVENIKRAYDFYVPIQTGDRTTVGKAATGESTEADLTFARVQEQAMRTILQGEQNLIRLAMADLARQYNITIAGTEQPLVEIGGAPVTRFNKETNSLEPGIDNFIFDDNTVPFFEMGERKFMRINDKDMQTAMRKYTGAERDSVITAAVGTAAKLNHIISIGKTALSPVFPMFNVLRDMGMTQLNPYPGVSRVTMAKHLADPRTWYDSFTNVARIARGKKPTGAFAQFVARGGMSQKSYIGLDDVVQDGSAEFIPTVKTRLKKTGEGAFNIATIWAQGFESGTRFAVYKAARENGLSDEQASVASKTTTLNFEERGTIPLSAYYIFGNAKVQGLYNMYKVLERMGGRNAALFGMSVVGMGLLAGFLGYKYSEKDKDGKSKFLKVPHYKKDSAIYFGEDSSIPGIPFPQELMPFYVLGNAAADSIWGDAPRGESISRVMTSWLNTAWPGNVPQQEIVGHKAAPSEFFLRAVLPSYFAPAVDIATNKTTFGSPVVSGYEEKKARGTPRSAMGTESTPEGYKDMAEWLYEKSDGRVDIAPQQIRQLNAYFNPFAESTAFFNDLLGGRDVRYQGDIVNPIERKFTAKATGFYDQDQFDALLAQAKQAKYQAEQKGLNALDPDQQVLAKSAAMLQRVQSDANNLFKGLKALTPERRMLLNERKQELLLSGIRRYNELRDSTRGR